jgi:hypothetical protein
VTLEAQFVGLQRDGVQLRLPNGALTDRFPLADFSAADAAYIQEAAQRLQEQQRARQQTAVVATTPAVKAVVPPPPPPRESNPPARAVESELPVEAPTVEMIQAEYLRVAKKSGFTIHYDPLFPDATMRGRPVSREEIEPLLARFFAAMDIFPVRFLKRTGLTAVSFCHDLHFRELPAAGVASGNLICLSSGFDSKVVYHELFHVIDAGPVNEKWTRLNRPTFAYGGSQFKPLGGDEELVRRNKRQQQELEQQKQLAAAAAADVSLRVDFVSDYAMTLEVEDRAETFAFMVADPADFSARCRESGVLVQKAALIRDIVRDYAPAMNKDFWAFIEKSDDASRQAEFLRRARLNDERHRQKKSLINSGYQTMDPVG